MLLRNDVLFKDEVTAVNGEVEVEVVGIGDRVQADVVLGVGPPIILNDNMVANNSFFSICS